MTENRTTVIHGAEAVGALSCLVVIAWLVYTGNRWAIGPLLAGYAIAYLSRILVEACTNG